MTVQDSKEKVVPNAAAAREFPDLSALFDAHIAREFADLDVDATMKTMVAEPYVYCVPVMTGGFGARASAASTVNTSLIRSPKTRR